MSTEKSTPEQGPQEQLSLRERQSQRQAEMETCLLDLSEEIEVWKLRLDEFADGDSPEQVQRFNELASQAIVSLDQKWKPFYGDTLHVSGQWYTPELASNGSSLHFPMIKREAFNVFPNNGFMVMNGDQKPRIGLSFVLGRMPLRSPAMQGDIDVLAFADINEVSLMYVHPSPQKTKRTSEKVNHRFVESVSLYDGLLDLHFSSPNSEFYRQSLTHQKRFLTDIVNNLNNFLPSPEYGEPALCDSVIAPYVYRRVLTDDCPAWEKIAADNGPIIMKGRVECIDLLETVKLDSGQPFRSQEQLVDKNAGVCLVLAVEACNVADRIFSDQPVYVPLRPAESLCLRVP